MAARLPRCTVVHAGTRCTRPANLHYRLPDGGLVCYADAKARGLQRDVPTAAYVRQTADDAR